MGVLQNQLASDVRQVFETVWTERNGQVVPDDQSLKLGNDTIILDATVLYADLSGSTKLVDDYPPLFAAEVYKTFLHCAAKIIKSEDGVITAYDGDRVMAVYIGDSKNTQAVRTGLKIHDSVRNTITPALRAMYAHRNYEIKHVVGIDTSQLHVARTGIRGANDLVWVGRAANYAAKLCSLSDDYPIRITADVYNNMNASVKYSGSGANMWQNETWIQMGYKTIYKSAFWWSGY